MSHHESLVDMPTQVAEIRALFSAHEPGADAAFPRMVGYVDAPFDRVRRRTLRLVRLHADGIRSGCVPRLEALCRILEAIARHGAAYGEAVRRRGQYLDGKPQVDMWWARYQARWLHWLINDAIQEGRKANGRETQLAADVLELVCEMLNYIPWERLPQNPRRSLSLRIGAVRWFGEELGRLITPDGTRELPGQRTSPCNQPGSPNVSLNPLHDTCDVG